MRVTVLALHLASVLAQEPPLLDKIEWLEGQVQKVDLLEQQVAALKQEHLRQQQMQIDSLAKTLAQVHAENERLRDAVARAGRSLRQALLIHSNTSSRREAAASRRRSNTSSRQAAATSSRRSSRAAAGPKAKPPRAGAARRDL